MEIVGRATWVKSQSTFSVVCLAVFARFSWRYIRLPSKARPGSMRDPEPPNVESEAMQAIRAWRATERKKLIESMDKLLALAQRLAESQYTRSSQRAKRTRLAGQLLWYKDQILRAMTWEALDQDVHRLMRDVYGDRNQPSGPRLQRITPAPFVPTIVKKRQEDDDVDKASRDADPEK